MENFTKLLDSIKTNTVFVLEFLGIILGVLIIAFIIEKLIKKKEKDNEKILTTRKIAVIGVFSALAGVLMAVEVPLLIFPNNYKFEIGDLAALISGFAFGPVAGVLVEFLKQLVKILIKPTETAFLGEFANFIVGCLFVLPATSLYWLKKTKKNALLSCIVGSVTMIVGGALLNGFYIIPAFAKLYNAPIEAIISMGADSNKMITSMFTYVLFGAVPINLLKSVACSALAMWLYKPLSKVWKEK